MQLDRIEALIRLVGQTGITQLDVAEDGFSLSITATGGAAAAPVPNNSPAAPAAPDSVTAPLSGTFYAAASPEAAPFVRDGDSVSAGQVLCIIEAMKSLNEVTAPQAGRIARCLVADGEGVEAGQPLFIIEQA